MIKYLVLIFAFALYLSTAHSLIELDGIKHNKDGTHTIVGTCSNNREFQITLTDVELEVVDVDKLVLRIKKICGE
jgi:hypothetical protein